MAVRVSKRMKRKFGLLLIAVLTYIFWQGISYGYRYFQPMEVVDIIKNSQGLSDDIVLNKPLLNELHFIDWWKKNKIIIRDKYQVPDIEQGKKTYSIYVWDIGDGYETDKNGEYKPGFIPEKYDQICFMELVQEERCVERKNRYAYIAEKDTGWSFIRFSSGNEYVQNDKGEFVKRKEIKH